MKRNSKSRPSTPALALLLGLGLLDGPAPASDLEPNPAHSLARRQHECDLDRNDDAARAECERAMAADPSSRQARLSVEHAAHTYAGRGRPGKAREYLEGLSDRLAHDELRNWVRYYRLRYLARTGSYEALLEAAEALAAESPASVYAPFALLDKGVIQLHVLGDVPSARQTFAGLVQRYPDSEAASTALTYLHPGGPPPAEADPPRVESLGNAPNPFNPQTVLSFALSRPAQVELTIYNVLGQQVRHLLQAPLPACTQKAVWDGTSDADQPVASGIYLYRLAGPGFAGTGRMLLLR